MNTHSQQLPILRLIVYSTLFRRNICKREAVVYATTTPHLPNFFILFLLTVIIRVFNNRHRGFQQPYRRC